MLKHFIRLHQRSHFDLWGRVLDGLTWAQFEFFFGDVVDRGDGLAHVGQRLLVVFASLSL